MKLRLLVLSALFAALLVPAARLYAAPRCFPEAAPAVSACVDGRFRAFWEQHGDLAVFGYPLSAPAKDETRPGAPITQRFERVWLELHPENRPPYDVLLGRMGVDVLAQRQLDWTTFPKGDPAAPHYFNETGHAIAHQFWGYWSSHGLEFDGRAGTTMAESLALFGLPVSEPRLESHAPGGQAYLTQWFERARFEYHPEHAGTPHEILLGLLGRELHDARSSPPASAAPTPTPALQPGGFIQVSGSQLTRLGQPVQLKGVNYYPQGRPWRAMWSVWNGPQVARELRLARDQLGINAVRVLLPYELQYPEARDGQVSADQLRRLREMAQIAGSLDLRLIVTLFDFHDAFPAPGSREEQEHFTYLRSLLGNFVGDDRIIAWDLHNEPDHYATWKQGRASEVLSWLGRMADEVHRIAPNHLVTVGMGFYENLLRAGPDGRRPIDYSDMVSLHSYNRRDLARQLDVLRANTTKPLVLEEFGWPTGITCLNRSYNEAEQAQLYHDALAAATGRTAGVFAWTLRDFDAGPSTRWDSREEYYGLYRPDDTLKPAAEEFRAYPASPLPSQLRTDQPLTTAGLPFTAAASDSPDEDRSPLLISGSGHYVKGVFRRAWALLGGQGSFGAPITEAFLVAGDIPERDRVVHYFEAGALELRQEAARSPDFPQLKEIDQIKRLIVPLEVGTAQAAGRIPTGHGHDVADVFQSFYSGTHGTWRLGAAITDAFVEDIGGVAITVQYFQNGRLQVNPVTKTIEAGDLGRSAWNARCASAAP